MEEKDAEHTVTVDAPKFKWLSLGKVEMLDQMKGVDYLKSLNSRQGRLKECLLLP